MEADEIWNCYCTAIDRLVRVSRSPPSPTVTSGLSVIRLILAYKIILFNEETSAHLPVLSLSLCP